MVISLLDWIYSSNDINGAFILYPHTLNRWNVSSFIISKWDNYKIVVVTDYPDEFYKIFTELDNTHWMDLELIRFSLVKYSNIDEINNLLHNSEVDLILFDDARMLSLISPLLSFNDIETKILILTTWGDSPDHINLITNTVTHLYLLSFNFPSINSLNLKFHIYSSTLSSSQLSFYNKIKDYESKLHRQTISYPITRMITLYSYPSSIQDSIINDLNNDLNICSSDNLSITDNLTSDTWLNKDFINSLPDDGPKLLSVIDSVISHWPSKQIIITRFNHRFGVDLIFSFFQLFTQNLKNPYDSHNIYKISCSDDYNVTLSKLHQFNENNSSILITNIVPLIPLDDISYIHIVDTYSFPTINSLLDHTYKHSLSHDKNIKDLNINLHIATHPVIQSSDVSLVNSLLTSVDNYNQLFLTLTNNSYKLSFSPELGLTLNTD